MTICVAFALGSAHAAENELQPRPAGSKPVLLLTGFEPFGRVKRNASWESVKVFQGREIGGYRIETALLPVVYDEMDSPLQAALKKFKPDVVISFGVGSNVVQVETVAYNGYHFWMPKDNKGLMPPRVRIDPKAPDLSPRTRLPADQIVSALREARIGAGISSDAGGYLCNECFYRLLMAKDAPLTCGFVHVPEFLRPDPAGGVYTPDKLIRAVQIVIETTLKEMKTENSTRATR